MRIPPRLSSKEVAEKIEKIISEPGQDYFGAQVKVHVVDAADGFDSPDLPQNLKESLVKANEEVFGAGKIPIYVGCGGAIPFMEVMA
jgi:acetylornithine deacetylase/succinyl-diaminopimelate desuccinylase-like protein